MKIKDQYIDEYISTQWGKTYHLRFLPKELYSAVQKKAPHLFEDDILIQKENIIEPAKDLNVNSKININKHNLNKLTDELSDLKDEL